MEYSRRGTHQEYRSMEYSTLTQLQEYRSMEYRTTPSEDVRVWSTQSSASTHAPTFLRRLEPGK